MDGIRSAAQLARITTPERTVEQDELDRRASAAAGGFEALGIGEGRTVAILMRNDIPCVEASIAAQKVGCYYVPVNWHSSPDEVIYVLEDCSADLLVVHADLWRSIEGRVAESCHVRIVPTPDYIAEAFKLAPEVCVPPAGMETWDDFIAKNTPRNAPDAPPRGAVIYTSGTTGKPKGVKRVPMDPALAARNVDVFRHTYGLAPDVRTLIVTPLYHASPNGFARYAATRGELLVLAPRFDSEEFLATVERYRINTVTAVPTMFVKLLKLPKEVRERYDTSSLRWVSHTASACPPEIKHAMIEWWGPILHEVYGGTEVGIAVHCSSEEWLQRPGTVGHCIDGCEMRIYSDDGVILPPGEPGEIYVRNETYAEFTYINRPDERAAVERDGFISIGDVGYVDEDGYLFISDRKRDMVIFGGTNIYPAEIESALIQHPGVADCAVIGLPDPEFGEVVAAYVKAANGTAPSESDLRAFLAERIAKFKIPKTFAFLPELPREESGKLMKRKLRDEFARTA
jgi:long-chain acyl-CoA synthetase